MSMSRFAPICVAAACVILSACATAPENSRRAAAPHGPRTETGEPMPAFDWVAERGRILRDLAGFPGVISRVRDDGALQLLLPGADAFAVDGEEPNAEFHSRLDRIGDVLAPAAETEIHIFGHTDSLASELHNLQLSIRRAEHIADRLRIRGVALVRLHPDGKGESEPIADNATEDGRARNRRVEIVVKPPRAAVANGSPGR